MKHRGCDRGGFTLLEMLATVTLLSLLAGLLTVRLAATSRVASFRSLEARIVDLDERARLFSRTGEPVVLAIPHDASVVELRHVGGGEPLVRVTLGEATSLVLSTTASVESIVYDRRGLTLDHELELRRGPDVARWRVSGESGWVTSLEADEEDAE